MRASRVRWLRHEGAAFRRARFLATACTAAMLTLTLPGSMALAAAIPLSTSPVALDPKGPAVERFGHLAGIGRIRTKLRLVSAREIGP